MNTPPAALDLTLPTLEENLALDEALLAEGEDSGAEVLRFWEWPGYAAVLGAGGQVALEVDEGACRAGAVPLARRSSGGGTVLLGPGCLLFSLVLRLDRAAELRSVAGSYGWILGRVARALEPLAGGRVEHAGTSDLAVAGRKFSGNSQHRKQRCLLHHGTILYAFDLERVGRYLRMPERVPEYRAGRGHRDFLRNLAAPADALK
ncbi:MAG TPA: lipoate--protein ligase family protein, partial [Gemmataceae bacterium]